MENMTQNSTPPIPKANTIANITLMTISLVLCVVGLIGNIATIVIIKFKESSHSVAYTTIGLLALVDTVAICFRSIVLVVLFHYSQWFDWGMPEDSITGLLVGAFVTLLSSRAHVVILARLRYKQLAHPMEGLCISSRRMILQSILAWSVCSIIGIPYGFHLYWSDIFLGDIVEITTSVLICLGTVIPILVFHILKTRKLRECITTRTHTIHSMNRMVIAICIVQVVSTISVATAIFVDFFTSSRTIYYNWTVQLLLLMSNVLNPIMFFHFKSCRRILGSARNNRENRNHYDDTRV